MEKENLQKCTLNVTGMHCAACELLIERKLGKVHGMKSVDAKLNSGVVEIEGNFSETPEELAEKFTELVKEDGYTIHADSVEEKKINYRDFIYAVPISLIIILIYILLQISGIQQTNFDQINYPAILFIGFIASLSSCAAVVGGLVLSLSANYAKENKKERFVPQVMFHMSRLASFFILGGVIGVIGSAFTLSVKMNFVLNLIIGIVMIILALNLFDLFSFTKKLQIKTPKSLSHSILKTENLTGRFAPVILGFITFFLPCGFTQSMQIYALKGGNFLDGALTMSVFALGTLPILAAISFASVNFAKNVKVSGVFYKTAGFVVLAFALLNILGAFVAIGLIEPFLNF